MPEIKELQDTELEKAVGGLNVYSDESTITMYFSGSDDPSALMYLIKNNINKQLGCYLDTNVTNDLQSLLNEMANTSKTYLKINYTKNGEFITSISVNTLL